MDTEPPPLQPPGIPSLPPSPPATNWRLYLELLSFTAFIFPLGNILGPLVLWLVKKDTIPLVNEEGKRVINFNLSWTLWSIATCASDFSRGSSSPSFPRSRPLTTSASSTR